MKARKIGNAIPVEALRGTPGGGSRRTTSTPSSSHVTEHLAAEKRFASWRARLLAATNALVIALAFLLLPPRAAVAADISYSESLQYSQAGYVEGESNFGADSCGGVLVCYDPSNNSPTRIPEFTLPQFNPALGTLESVNFTPYIFVEGFVQASCSYVVSCDSTASLYVESTINLDDVQTTGAGGPLINFGIFGPAFGPSAEIQNGVGCHASAIFSLATCENDSGDFSTFYNTPIVFPETSVAPFVGTDQINFYAAPNPYPSFEWGLTQTDTLDTLLGDIHSAGIGVAEDGYCEGVDCLVDLGFDLAELITGEQGLNSGCCDGTGGVYVDDSVTIDYTYEPATASGVPEPSTLALLSTAVPVFVVACRRRRARARAQVHSDVRDVVGLDQLGERRAFRTNRPHI